MHLPTLANRRTHTLTKHHKSNTLLALGLPRVKGTVQPPVSTNTKMRMVGLGALLPMGMRWAAGWDAGRRGEGMGGAAERGGVWRWGYRGLMGGIETGDAWEQIC